VAIKIRKRRAAGITLCIVVLLFVLYEIFPLVVTQVATGHLKSVFMQQSELLEKPISSLGIVGQPKVTLQCIDELHTHWQTQLICENFTSYPYNATPISQAAKNTYATNAAKLDQLLKQNGWVNDRPHDQITSLVASNPYAPQNGGLGGDIPFHKNIGAISCNLEIDFEGLSHADTVDPGSISVNDFGCQQTITYFMPHLTNWQSLGP
jgi:hypothetical protein